MKKHIIAAAVAAAVAGPAMAQVTVSGTLDVSAQRTNKVETRSADNVVANTTKKNTGSGDLGATSSADGWATSEMIFQATEDLGGGLKATARFSQALSSNTSANIFSQRDKYIDVAGGFGSVRLGRFNPTVAGLNAYSGAGTTSAAGSLENMTTGGTQIIATEPSTLASFQRNNGLIAFTSPSFSGLSFNVLYADNSSDLTTTANTVTESKLQGFGASYTAGPLKVEFASAQRKNKTAATAAVQATAFFFNGTTNATATQTVAATTTGIGTSIFSNAAFGAATTGTMPIGQGANTAVTVQGIITRAGVTAVEALDAKHDFDWLGVSYNFGVATVLASHSRRQLMSNTTTTTAQATQNDIKLNSIGLMVPFGATTLRVSTYTGKDERTVVATDDVKLTGQQLSATYSLSKRTYLYAVTGENDIKRDNTASVAIERTEKSTGFGLVHSF